MSELSELTDQEVVNLICELRPKGGTTPLGVEVEIQHIDWPRLQAAEEELLNRGYTEASRSYWTSNDESKPHLIERR